MEANVIFHVWQGMHRVVQVAHRILQLHMVQTFRISSLTALVLV